LPLFIIEGPVIGIISGILIAFEALQFLPVFFLYVAGTLISDTVLYYLARGGDRYIKKLPFGGRVSRRLHLLLDDPDKDWPDRFKKNYFWLLFSTRLAPVSFVSQIVVLAAGWLRIPPRKFYAPIFVAQPIWSAAILGLGYYFGDVIANPQQILTQASLLSIAVVVLFFLYRRYIHTYLKHSLLHRLMDEAR
jgi:membrane protein DedA with SNARE-associated domain